MDPNQIGRPASISIALAIQNWTSGTYTYAGAGNVTKAGNAATGQRIDTPHVHGANINVGPSGRST